MNKHRAFELEVLGRVTEDYEAPHTIVGDIVRDTGRITNESEVRAALLALAQRGLVQTYVYDSGGHRYRPITHSEALAVGDPWFMSTAAGNAELERDAN